MFGTLKLENLCLHQMSDLAKERLRKNIVRSRKYSKHPCNGRKGSFARP